MRGHRQGDEGGGVVKPALESPRTGSTFKHEPCGCEVQGVGLLPDPWRVKFCALHQSAPALKLALEQILARHDERNDCDLYRPGAIYERGPRPKKDGRRYFFALVGPEGQGYYPCWCNGPRAVVVRAKGGQ